MMDRPQALEVMAINHKNNASKKCLHGNMVLPCGHCHFRAYFNDLW